MSYTLSHITNIIIFDVVRPYSHGILIYIFFVIIVHQCLKFLFMETYHRGWWHRSPVARMTTYYKDCIPILSIVKSL